MQYGNEDFLAGLVAEACGKNPSLPSVCACLTMFVYLQ